jgi:hypothetical protein
MIRMQVQNNADPEITTLMEIPCFYEKASNLRCGEAGGLAAFLV